MIWEKFWILLVKQYSHTDIHRKKYYLCICECGVEKAIARAALIRWLTKSCWCLRKVMTSIRATTHGKTWTISYHIWQWMQSRCYNPSHRQFKDYWWRWIIIEWKSFQEFYIDIGNTLSKWLSIERIDVNKNYSKQNCIVIPLKDQNKNRQSTIRVNQNWITMCLKDACKIKWVPYERIRQRITRLGWDIDRALNS